MVVPRVYYSASLFFVVLSFTNMFYSILCLGDSIARYAMIVKKRRSSVSSLLRKEKEARAREETTPTISEQIDSIKKVSSIMSQQHH